MMDTDHPGGRAGGERVMYALQEQAAYNPGLEEEAPETSEVICECGNVKTIYVEMVRNLCARYGSYMRAVDPRDMMCEECGAHMEF